MIPTPPYTLDNTAGCAPTVRLAVGPVRAEVPATNASAFAAGVLLGGIGALVLLDSR